MSKEWDSTARVAAAVGGRAFSVEVGIPFVELGLAARSATQPWAIQVARERHAGGKLELSSYMRFGGSFHVPSTYAPLELKGADLRRYLWEIKAPLEPLVVKDGDRLRVGPLEFEVRLVAELCVDERPEPEAAPKAADPTSGSFADDDLDISQWLGDMPAPATTSPSAGAKSPEGTGPESAAPGEAIEEASELPPSEPGKDVSEELKEEMRRRRAIVGVSKAAQAKRLSETSRDAAADALKKFFS